VTAATAAFVVAAAALAGCDWSLQRMNDQPRCEPGKATALFADGSCNQDPPLRTVRWRGAPPDVAAVLAVPVTPSMIARGQDRFDRFCAPCHGPLGDGQSQVAENMILRPPPSLYEPRIVAFAEAQYYRVITEGYGFMPSYAHDLPPNDRRAIIAYVRVLQRSQDVALDRLPAALREEALKWLP
jgi:mono/diheme cytochrome c family protein